MFRGNINALPTLLVSIEEQNSIIHDKFFGSAHPLCAAKNLQGLNYEYQLSRRQALYA